MSQFNFTVYLAEPIDLANGHFSMGDYVAEVLVQEPAFNVYRPSQAWSVEPGTDERSATLVNDVNNAALRGSDVVVAVLPRGANTVGVPAEIGMATQLGIRCVVLRDAPSTWLDGNDKVAVLPLDTQPEGIVEAVRDCAIESPNWKVAPGSGELLPLPYSAPAGHPGLVRHYTDDAAFDLFTTEDFTIEDGQYAFIPCGVRIELPDGVFGWVVARSSTFRDWGIVAMPGIIDTGFRGEMMVSAFRQPRDDLDSYAFIPAGTRLAQIVLLPNLAAGYTPVRVDGVKQTWRGESGFGSTGQGGSPNGHQITHSQHWAELRAADMED